MSRLVHRPHAIALIAVMLVACARVGSAQDWAARYPRDPACDLQWARHSTPEPTGALSRLVVRPVVAGTDTLIHYSVVRLTPLDRTGTDTATLARIAHSDADLATFDSLPAGRYRLHSSFVGWGRDQDTIIVAPGHVDTVTSGLFDFFSYYRNTSNCRPRGFRMKGHSACITTGEDVAFELRLMRAHSGGEGEGQRSVPPFPAGAARVVTNERVCEAAGRAYDSTSPPRRVIVIEARGTYLVYDPQEPLEVGEWNGHCFFDRRWHALVCLAV